MKTATINKPVVSSIDTPEGFRFEALTIIRTAVNQRRKLVQMNKSYIVLDKSIIQVLKQYDAYKSTWSVRGIARFIYKYYHTIERIIPASNPTAKQRLHELLSTAKKYSYQ